MAIYHQSAVVIGVCGLSVTRLMRSGEFPAALLYISGHFYTLFRYLPFDCTRTCVKQGVGITYHDVLTQSQT